MNCVEGGQEIRVQRHRVGLKKPKRVARAIDDIDADYLETRALVPHACTPSAAKEIEQPWLPCAKRRFHRPTPTQNT